MSATGRKLAFGSTIRIVLMGATAVVSFFMMPFVVHTLGDRMYGVWTLVATFIGYYGLLDLGFTSAVTRYLAGSMGSQDEEQCKRVFNTSVAVFAGLGVLVLLAAAIVAALAPLFCRTAEDASLFWRVILIL